jgi:hypothetical protein
MQNLIIVFWKFYISNLGGGANVSLGLYNSYMDNSAKSGLLISKKRKYK